MWNGLLAQFPSIPQPCLLCDQPSPERLCQGCRLQLPYLTRYRHRCTLCALPLGTDSAYCGHCLREPPPFERCRLACSYEFPLDHLIHAFKYQRQLTAGRALSELLIEHLQEERQEATEADWPDCLVPVPMHWSRRLKRGFNQTELLAKDIGRHLDLPVYSRLCRRHQRTRAQQGLTRTARIHNLRNAFELRPRAAEKLTGKRVALVDDVVTTTSTVRALSRLLTSAGATFIEVWALARTPEGH